MRHNCKKDEKFPLWNKENILIQNKKTVQTLKGNDVNKIEEKYSQRQNNKL